MISVEIRALIRIKNDNSKIFISGTITTGIAVLAVIGLHLWKRNTLLSIIVGTVVCMFLVQVVF